MKNPVVRCCKDRTHVLVPHEQSSPNQRCKELTLIDILIVNAVFALMVSKFFGLVNLQLGMLVLAAITPMGAALHDPVVICFPFVKGLSGTVAQKLMKLLLDVADGTWPSVGVC